MATHGGKRKTSGRYPKGAEARIKTSIALEPELKEKGQAIADQRQISLSELINELLRNL